MNINPLERMPNRIEVPPTPAVEKARNNLEEKKRAEAEKKKRRKEAEDKGKVSHQGLGENIDISV